MRINAKHKFYLSLTVIVLTLLPVVLFALGLDILMILAVEAFAVLVCLSLENFYSNIFFLCFLLSFFVFLMSGDIVSQITGKYYYIKFGEEATTHCWIAILISLVFMGFGYVCMRKPVDKTASVEIEDTTKLERIQKASKLVYYLTYFVLMFNTVDKVLFVSVNGYVAYYSSYVSSLPGIVAELGDFAPIALCVFLATFPKKKNAMLPIALYFAYALLSLMIGARGGLVYNSVFLLGYMLYRNWHDKGHTVWISKKVIALLCVSVPFFLVFLFVYGYIRLEQNIVFNSFGDTLVDFFVNIGSSSTVIKYGYEYRDSIDSFKFYSLGDTLNYFDYGRLFNLFSSEAIPSVHSKEFALNGHSFDAFISYQFMRDKYLAGEGAGSSFIAVLFADFGYIGVAIGSFIYGLVFKSLSNMKGKSWLSTAIKLYFFLSLIKAPRGSYDGFLAGIINITFWVVIIGIVVLSKFMKTRRKE